MYKNKSVLMVFVLVRRLFNNKTPLRVLYIYGRLFPFLICYVQEYVGACTLVLEEWTVDGLVSFKVLVVHGGVHKRQKEVQGDEEEV